MNEYEQLIIDALGSTCAKISSSLLSLEDKKSVLFFGVKYDLLKVNNRDDSSPRHLIRQNFIYFINNIDQVPVSIQHPDSIAFEDEEERKILLLADNLIKKIDNFLQFKKKESDYAQSALMQKFYVEDNKTAIVPPQLANGFAKVFDELHRNPSTNVLSQEAEDYLSFGESFKDLFVILFCKYGSIMAESSSENSEILDFVRNRVNFLCGIYTDFTRIFNPMLILPSQELPTPVQ